MANLERSLTTVDGKEVYPGDEIKVVERIMELDETFEQQGVLTYDKKEEKFYIEGYDTEVNIWNHIHLVRTKNARKTVKSE